MLEGRDKCEMKLTKPLKFKTGRRDCKTEEDRKYVTKDYEVVITIFLKWESIISPSPSYTPTHGETVDTWSIMVERRSAWLLSTGWRCRRFTGPRTGLA